MDVLRPGHAHRSSSDRLLSNYLDSQKHLSQSLLSLLSHSHASTSSLLAYTTSSPGVHQPVRKAVRHAGFEGPLSGALLEAHGSQLGSNININGGGEDAGWHAYITCLDNFRQDLKHIHQLEEEMSRVRRDREILVTRLIKTTKSRPTKNDLSAIAKEYSQSNLSSRASNVSMTSNGSMASKEGKRAGKLADAQGELLGCEEHLRALELKIERERNQVMLRGLEDRFRAMEAVGAMWISQAKKGLSDMNKMHGPSHEAFELDSNGSIAPSQSASQTGYDDHQRSPRRGSGGGVPFPRSRHHPEVPGSITGSIAEEDESSDDEGPRNLVVHENRPGAATPQPGRSASRMSVGAKQPSPLGLSSAINRNGGGHGGGYGQGDSDSDAPNRRGGRRAASDIGTGYRPITKRHSLGGLHRTNSADRARPPSLRRRGSDSTIGSGRGVPVKKKGFFASIGRLFKSNNKKRDGRGGSSVGGAGGWSTRTDSNLRSGSFSRGRGDDSSSDEDGGNLVAVSNNRNSTWSVDNVGRGTGGSNAGGSKRNSAMPVASGLIPPKPQRQSSQSTITGRSVATANGRTTPTPASVRAGAKSPSGGSIGQAPPSGISRSNTMRSTASVATARTATTIKSASGPGAKSATPSSAAGAGAGTGGTLKKTRPNGSISRTSRNEAPATNRNSMMSLVKPEAPTMPEIPKAPRSQVTPQLDLPKAPGSSIVRPGDAAMLAPSTKPGITRSASQRTATTTKSRDAGDELYPHHSISRSNSVQRVPKVSDTKGDAGAGAPAPRPPSRSLAPPLKSALRPSSPAPPPEPTQPIEMFSISAPGPVQVPREEVKPAMLPGADKVAGSERPRPGTRNSYHSVTTEGGESVYESAVEDGGDESSSDEDDEVGYDVVDNERVKRLGINIGEDVHKVRGGRYEDEEDEDSDGTAGPVDSPRAQRQTIAGVGAARAEEDSVSRRKSVRITAPDSPITTLHPTQAPGRVTDGPEGYAAPSGPPPAAGAGAAPGRDERDGSESPEPGSNSGQQSKTRWDTRIGRVREDDSEGEEEEGDDAYARAKRGLSRNTGEFGGKEKSKKGSGTSASGAGSAQGAGAGVRRSKSLGGSSVKSGGSRR